MTDDFRLFARPLNYRGAEQASGLPSGGSANPMEGYQKLGKAILAPDPVRTPEMGQSRDKRGACHTGALRPIVGPLLRAHSLCPRQQ